MSTDTNINTKTNKDTKGMLQFTFWAFPQHILLHFPNNLLHFPIKIASFTQKNAAFSQQFTAFPQQIASFPQQFDAFPHAILCHFAKKELPNIFIFSPYLRLNFVWNVSNEHLSSRHPPPHPHNINLDTAGRSHYKCRIVIGVENNLSNPMSWRCTNSATKVTCLLTQKLWNMWKIFFLRHCPKMHNFCIVGRSQCYKEKANIKTNFPGKPTHDMKSLTNMGFVISAGNILSQPYLIIVSYISYDVGVKFFK